MQQNEPLYISDPLSKDLKYTAALIGCIFHLRRRNAWQRRSVSQAARRRGGDHGLMESEAASASLRRETDRAAPA